MKERVTFAPLALGLLVGVSVAVGGTPAAHAGEVSNPLSIASTQQDDVLRATLDNGLRVVIVRDTLAPVVTTQITYLAGSYEAPQGFPGTAHALEHMMFRGSKGMTGAQLNEMTGKMGAENNAFTTDDATQYYFTAPAQYLDMLLHIEAIRMRGAELTDKEWDLEKGAIEQEVSGDISDPEFLADMQAEKILYGGTAYAEDALGSRPSFDKTTGAILRKFYDQWYVPNNAILVIAGDIDPQATLAKVKQLFGPIASGQLPERAPVKLESFKQQTIAKTTPNATGSVQYLFRMPGQQSKDFAAMEVLMDALNNDRSKLRELAAQGKVLGAKTDWEPYVHGGIGSIQVQIPKGGDSRRAQEYLDDVINDVRTRGVPADLVEAEKRNTRVGLEFNRNSTNSLASMWSQALAWRGLNSPQEGLNQVLAVTPADVERVAREYLNPNQRVTLVLTPSRNGKRPPDSQGFGGTEEFSGDDKLNTPLPGWAIRALARRVMPHWTLDPVRMTLPNGITLIVQPTNVSKTVTVVGDIDHDDQLQEPAGQEGVGSLLGSLFDYGTTALDREEFHKALDAIAANELSGSQFLISVPSEYFDRGVELLADNELHPALPQSAFVVQQKDLARELAGEMQTPSYKWSRALYKDLYPVGDPALRHPTPATVDKLTLADVEAYFKQAYRPDMTTMVVVGDVTPEQAKAVVEKYFGAWKATGPKPNVIPTPVPLNSAGYVVVHDPYASQDSVLMGQTLALNLHNPDHYALQLANDVLGGNGFASRLMEDIRVNHGFAYGAGSGMQFERSRSMFVVQYSSDSDKVAPVDALIRKDLAKMRDTPVSEAELDNARQYEIRSIPLQVSSVGGIAQSLLDWSKNGEPLNEPMVAAKYYLTLTARQVQDAFKKYIEPTNLVQAVEGPAPNRH